MRPKFFSKFFALASLGLLMGVMGQTPFENRLGEADKILSAPGLNFQKAGQALVIYEEQLPKAHHPGERISLQVALCKTCFNLGDLAPKDQKMTWYEKGEHYAEILSREQPHGAAGYYWMAMNLCGEADVHRGMKALKLMPRVVKELNRSLALDATYDQAGAHRLLGRIYYEAPAWPISIGDIKKSHEHLTEAVRLAPENSTNHLYLGETLIRLDRLDEACQELEQVFKSCSHAIRSDLMEEDRREAQQLLKDCREGKFKRGKTLPPESSG